jgi:NADPH:quinone reductase
VRPVPPAATCARSHPPRRALGAPGQDEGMTRRVIVSRYGVPDGIEVVDEQLPPLEPGQVRIRVRSSGINPYEVRTAQGVFGDDPAKLPLRLGGEVAGVIAEVGADAEGAVGPLEVGDEVVGFRVPAGWAEEVVASGRNVFPKPASASFDEAAGLMLVGTTAWHLVEAAGVGEGDRVIVHGASGGVGATAVQLAVHRGATVLGTASASNQDYVAGLGATPVVYGDGLEARLRELLPDGADAALDAVGTDEALSSSVALVADRGRIVTAAGFPRNQELGIRAVGSGPGADRGTELRNAARGPLLELLGSGVLSVRIGAVLPLERAGEALALVAGGHPGGKVMLAP